MNEIIKKNGVTYGAILGLVSIATTTLVYVTDVKLFMNWWVGGISIILNIVIGVILVSKTKKQLNDVITFKEGFSVYFIAGALGSTIASLYNYVLFNFIDPQAKETLKEMTIKYTVEMMEKFGTPKEALNQAIAEMQKADNYSLGNIFMGLIFMFVIVALFGLILAAIFKSKSPSSQGL
ncbi:DUF4199 domain-containing protein [Flavobacterium sangjuense]|uniref:DUF4199 domain-containing protein n=1 Tax=Flavobacterium sangjuense TaxID=2518177 RepID=A0A4P7PVW1_9FLAO|nr:DUF4199 domain-containing protein [Flavobacterium sangjuense]QBZ99159.1 hypothetical protein GS03_02681 [Flavobacterium sangjuense]